MLVGKVFAFAILFSIAFSTNEGETISNEESPVDIADVNIEGLPDYANVDYDIVNVEYVPDEEC